MYVHGYYSYHLYHCTYIRMYVSMCIDPLLLYQCTTDYGSSGSPVFKEVDGELKVVALHRGGQETGDKWLGYNCGTLIKEILNHLYGNQTQSCELELKQTYRIHGNFRGT